MKKQPWRVKPTAALIRLKIAKHNFLRDNFRIFYNLNIHVRKCKEENFNHFVFCVRKPLEKCYRSSRSASYRFLLAEVNQKLTLLLEG